MVLAWVPFRFGSNHLISWSINAVLLSLLLVAFEAGKLVLGAKRPVAIRHIAWAGAVLAGLIGWILFQLSPYAPSAWQNDFWSLTRDVLAQIPGAEVVQGRISVTPDAGLIGLMKLVTCAAAFYLALQLCRDQRRADFLMIGFVLIALGYAIFGIVQEVAFPDRVLWIQKTAYEHFVVSTFINRNNYATYAGMGVIVTLGVLFESYRRAGVGRRLPFGQRLATLIEVTPRTGLPIAVALVTIMISLIWTGSRGGVLTTLGGVTMLLLPLFLMAGSRKTMLVATLAVVAAVLLVMVGYGGDLAERFADSAGAGERRFDVVRRVWEAALDVPWTGFGYGSFDRMFAVYRNTDMLLRAHWDKAHNTYVELLFDLGFPAAIAFFGLVGGLIGSIVFRLSQRETRPIYCLVVLAVSFQVLMHAVVDFSLQIQGVTITFWILLGAGVAQSWSRQVDTSI
ncbi:O-antigen ligase family protein [Ancylobacter pratisalsi]|uniref:O-antigen ligase family protein n=1 Tax=Ancylobacter pratisalsi TaxID=1745854 RepID=A0A6P1YQQ7_9HYPH|nr:O-antigen ligase family protein [Ancylobacter pratisalsi]QIB35462.1 O-antigen ligase family protein [Ancylobacter pratisalsi]